MKYLEEQSGLNFSDTHDDEQITRFLTRQVDTFVKYLREHYSDKEYTKNLIKKFTGVQLLPYTKGNTPSSYISGMFDHSTGMLKVAARDGSGKIRDEESLNKSITHELAHATRMKYPGEQSHSNEWKRVWKIFLHIATEELGWTVDASCQFYGLSPKDCPKCIWRRGEQCDAVPLLA
jgi:hypothetical protein